jgi:hypothetical protein
LNILVRYEGNPAAVEYASAQPGDIWLALLKPELAETYIKNAISCRALY